jgi:hypothetical protein
MFKLACILNALLVLPFAASALAAPDFTFAQFGIDLGTEGAGVARGYGASALGWGIACGLLRGATESTVVKALMTGPWLSMGQKSCCRRPLRYLEQHPQ